MTMEAGSLHIAFHPIHARTKPRAGPLDGINCAQLLVKVESRPLPLDDFRIMFGNSATALS